MIPNSLVVTEKEQPVAQDRPPQGAPENLLRIDILFDARKVVGPGVGVQVVIFQKVVGASVEAVGPGLGGKKDFTAIDVAIFRIGIRCDDLDLLDCLGRRVVTNIIAEGFVDVGAVQNLVVGLLAVSVERGHIGGAGITLDGVVAGEAGRFRRNGAGKILGQSGKVGTV